jgi:hypothetical protein
MIRPPGRSVLGLGLVLTAMAALASPAGASTPGMLTLQFGRTQLVMTGDGCLPLTNAVSLGKIAAGMHRMGFAGTGAVVLDFTSAGSWSCRGSIRYPGWRALATLHRRYGFSYVSAGRRYVDVRRLSLADQRRDICGSLPAFAAHGYPRAWGLFAYPDDHSSAEVQRQVTSRCFAYGRTYDHHINLRSSMQPPWFQKTFSVDGGACNLPQLACYKIVTPVWPAHYMSPIMLAGLMHPSANEWRVVQMYRFVRRSRLSGKIRWDCRSSDWRRHWTTRIEVYCARDYFRALRTIPESVQVVHPARVARLWGRRMG